MIKLKVSFAHSGFTLLIIGIAATALVSGLVGCNPIYVARVSVEEAGILWRREPISELLKNPTLDEKRRRQFELVLAARDFSPSLGLKPAGSFEQFSEVDRDVLVWVLSATRKDALVPYTWWYPIVGSVPYKGFFSREEAVAAGERLMAKDYDFIVRPSLAYSTLGWFDDPLISTLLQLDEISLVETVFHEILHNTLWVKNYVDFNESLANFVGVFSAAKFYETRGELAARDEVVARWRDQIYYAQYLEGYYDRLVAVLGTEVKKRSDAERAQVLAERERLLEEAAFEWEVIRGSLNYPDGYRKRQALNNSVILANRVYMRDLWHFERLWNQVGGEPVIFLERIQKVVDDAERQEVDPFESLAQYLDTSGIAK